MTAQPREHGHEHPMGDRAPRQCWRTDCPDSRWPQVPARRLDAFGLKRVAA